LKSLYTLRSQRGRDFSDLSLISPFTPLGMFLTRGGDNGRDKGEMREGYREG
jgi:hypothetical protein